VNCTLLGYYAVRSGNSSLTFPIGPNFEGQESKKESHNKDVVGISQILFYASLEWINKQQTLIFLED
jgi:hypothetical protein